MEQFEGKAKIVRILDAGTVEIFYKDDATAFDGKQHEQFPGKGELNSEITELLFDYLEGRGVATHHRGRLDERTLAADRVGIVPLEVVVRFRVAGSLQKRTGLEYLTPCDPPIVEFYFKRDDLGDPLLNREHIRMLGLASDAEIAELADRAVEAADHLHRLFAGAGIDLVDLKFEFGRSSRGLVLADEISPDTCRFRDSTTGEILDKDLFRFGGGDLMTGYRTLLERLKDALATAGPG